MFKISLPVQRFVIGCILLMILIIGADYMLNDIWLWQDHLQDMILQARTI